MGGKSNTTYDFSHYIEADATPNTGGWPKGRDPQQLLGAISNRHLEYVITWYGLALALLGVYGFFLYGKRRSEYETSGNH
jgi:surfeit locus 1 family protein